MQPIYYGPSPMHVVGLFSGGASAIRSMLEDPNHGSLYILTGAATHNPNASGIEHLSPHMKVVMFLHPQEYFSREGLDPRKRDSRFRYWEYVGNIIRKFEADVIALSGLMLIVRYPLISEEHDSQRMEGEFHNMVFNVHPADLAILTDGTLRYDASLASAGSTRELMKNNSSQRKYKGDDAVTDALRAGENATRSTIHIATRDVDEGPLLVRSQEVDASNVSLEKAKDLQEYMKWHCDGPAFRKAMELVASHRLAVDEIGTVFMLQEGGMWRELPYGGYVMEGRLTPEIKQ